MSLHSADLPRLHDWTNVILLQVTSFKLQIVSLREMGENVKSPKQPKMLEHVENKKSELLDTQFSKKIQLA